MTHSCFVAMDHMENMEVMKNVVDVSSFLLFEASGDSEADNSDPIMAGGSGNVASVAMAEDDAQSCSCDSTDLPCVGELNDDIGHSEHVQAYSHGGHHEEDWKEEEEEEEDTVYQRWGGEDFGMPLMGGNQMKSTVSADSTKEFELLNEMEKSRLFWETCLAS